MDASTHFSPPHRGSPPGREAGVEGALAPAKCAESLREAMRTLCAPYGRIRGITLFPVRTPQRDAIVGIVDMDSPRAQQVVALELGLLTFGASSVVIRVDAPGFRIADPAHWDFKA